MQKYASELSQNSTGSWIRQRISMNQLASKKPIEKNSPFEQEKNKLEYFWSK